jgi:hypothetical protein
VPTKKTPRRNLRKRAERADKTVLGLYLARLEHRDDDDSLARSLAQGTPGFIGDLRYDTPGAAERIAALNRGDNLLIGLMSALNVIASADFGDNDPGVLNAMQRVNTMVRRLKIPKRLEPQIEDLVRAVELASDVRTGNYFRNGDGFTKQPTDFLARMAKLPATLTDFLQKWPQHPIDPELAEAAVNAWPTRRKWGAFVKLAYKARMGRLNPKTLKTGVSRWKAFDRERGKEALAMLAKR